MSVNFSVKTPRNSITSTDSQTSSLFLTYKRFEYLESLSLLEKSMLFLSNQEKKILRKELKSSNCSLEFLLMKHRNNKDKGMLSLDLKKFVKNSKKKSLQSQNLTSPNTITKSIHSPRKTCINLENIQPFLKKRSNENLKTSPKQKLKKFFKENLVKKNTENNKNIFESSYENYNKNINQKAKTSPKQILGNSNENKRNLPFQTSTELSSKISDFSQIINIFENPKTKFFTFSQYNEKLKEKFLREYSFISKIPIVLSIEDPETLIKALFFEKNLFKISNAYFRFRLKPFLDVNMSETDKTLFLNHLFEVCDLKGDGLLEINEIGLSFDLIYQISKICPNNLMKIWFTLDKNKKNFVFLHELPHNNKLIACDVEKKGFLTYWDLFLRELQEGDLKENPLI